jgi:hypothetical protein
VKSVEEVANDVIDDTFAREGMMAPEAVETEAVLR